METDEFTPVTLLTRERMEALDSESRAVVALATTGVLGGGLREASRYPLPRGRGDHGRARARGGRRGAGRR